MADVNKTLKGLDKIKKDLQRSNALKSGWVFKYNKVSSANFFDGLTEFQRNLIYYRDGVTKEIKG